MGIYDYSLAKMAAKARLDALEEERRQQELEKQLALGQLDAQKQKQVIDLIPQLIGSGLKVADFGKGLYDKEQDKTKNDLVADALTQSTKGQKTLEAIDDLPETTIDYEMTPEERADKAIAKYAEDYKKNPLSAGTLNQDTLDKLKPHLVQAIQKSDQDKAMASLASQKAAGEASKAMTEAKYAAPKAESEILAKQAGTEKDYSDSQKTKLATVAGSVDKARIKQILGNKDPEQRDQALEEYANEISDATDFSPKLVRGVVGSAAFSLADDSEKDALKASQWAKEQGLKWATLEETKRMNKDKIALGDRKVAAAKEVLGLKESRMSDGTQKEIGEMQGSIEGLNNVQERYNKWREKNPAVVGEALKAKINDVGAKVGLPLDPQRRALTLDMAGKALSYIHENEGRIDPFDAARFGKALSDASSPDEVNEIIDELKSSLVAKQKGILKTQSMIGKDTHGIENVNDNTESDETGGDAVDSILEDLLK